MSVVTSRRFFLVGTAAFALSGCAVARGAPSRREVVAGADADDADFALEVVTRDRLPIYPQWGPSNGAKQTGWPSGGAAPQDQRLAPGDILALRIWDSEPSSLITAPDAQFSDVANLTVSGSGHVNLPYVGEVHVGGVTANTARNQLQEALRSIIPSAELQMETKQGRRNSVDIIGGVVNPGSFPLTERNLSLTSVLASAGGVDTSLDNPQVQITRGGHTYRRPLKFILSNPQNDANLQGGDRIVIAADPRSFKALGASDREEVIGFDDDSVSALRAIALMGGMADTRADPRGILVLRRYPEDAALRPNPPPNVRMVFSFDLTSASGLFSADEFKLQNDDIVMVTQAPATTTQRVLALFGSGLGFGRALSNL